MSASETFELTQRQADIIGRQFNSVLTNTVAYSPGHAVTQRAAETFVETLGKSLAGRESLTLMLDRGGLFVEDFALDSRFNPTRIARIFRELELHSVTFLEGLDVFAVEALMAVLADHEDYLDVSSAQAELKNRGISTIQLNHVVMRKVTSDDEVIEREGLEKLTDLAERQVRAEGATPEAAVSAPAASAPAGSAKKSTSSAGLMARIEEVFSMQALVERPEDLAGQMIARAWTGDEDPARIAGQVRALRAEIGQDSDSDDSAPSLTQVMEAVARVRAEISETLSSQKEIAHFMAESGGEMLDEVEQMTCDTVLAIVREEYRGGEVSVRRLAQIMRRVLPEGRDIKRFLPQLKQGLMAEGMPLNDYIALVRELGEELKSDQLTELLEQGSEAVGVSFDELLREIRHDPDEAARLLVLAAELRGLGGKDPERLSNILAEYVERVSSELVDVPESGTAGKRELKRLLRERRRELVEQIGAGGVPEAVARGVEKRLDGNLDQAVDVLRVRGLAEQLAGGGTGTLEITELAEALAGALDDDTDLKRLGTKLQGELVQRGYDAEQLRKAFEQTERRLRNRSRLELLPDGMLEPNVLNYLLEREIAACRRFGTYFSCVLLMIARVAEAGDTLYDGEHDWRTAETGEIEELLPQLFRTLPPHVRDIDLLGSLGSRERNIPLVVLTMAHEDGARIVLERMLSAIAEQRFELAGEGVWVDAVGVAERFDFESTPDRKSWLNHLQSRLAQELMKKMRGG